MHLPKPARSTLRVAAVIAVSLGLAACGGSREPEYVERPVEELYNDGMDALDAGNYQTAARLFDEVERQHPYSAWATKAQLMAAHAHYENDSFDEAIVALDRFIQLHPGSPDIAFAYYLRAMTYYKQITDVGRDQRVTALAMNALDEVVRRFPNTDYARDSALKLDLTRDHLAGKEMEIGRFYLKRRGWLAAINRFKTVVDEYQTTTHVPEALHRLTEAYLALGLRDQAYQVASVLGHNYPGSEWYIDSYALLEGVDVRPPEERPGMVRRAWNSIF
ncbi:MAG: outer membrane protein assembly factor BamD [Alphaproteobacteria bacterium]